MRKFFIVLVGVLLLGSMAYLTSCEDDFEYVSCDGTTCSDDEPYSNQYTDSCFSSKSTCEDDTGHSCKDCS